MRHTLVALPPPTRLACNALRPALEQHRPFPPTCGFFLLFCFAHVSRTNIASGYRSKHSSYSSMAITRSVSRTGLGGCKECVHACMCARACVHVCVCMCMHVFIFCVRAIKKWMRLVKDLVPALGVLAYLRVCMLTHVKAQTLPHLSFLCLTFTLPDLTVPDLPYLPLLPSQAAAGRRLRRRLVPSWWRPARPSSGRPP